MSFNALKIRADFPALTQKVRGKYLIYLDSAATALKPIDQRSVFGKTVMLFDGVPRTQLATFGETRHPNVADLFVATMKGTY